MWGMQPTQATAVTWKDFLALPDDDRRELIEGRLMELEVPTQLHEHIVAMLIYYLMGWRKTGGGGRVLSSGYKVRIHDDQAFMPDVQYFKSGRAVPELGLTEGGPDLVVEVISPSSVRFDEVDKLEGYASIGTAEYWLIDPENRALCRHVLGPENHVIVEKFSKVMRSSSPPPSQAWRSRSVNCGTCLKTSRPTRPRASLQVTEDKDQQDRRSRRRWRGSSRSARSSSPAPPRECTPTGRSVATALP